MFTQIKDILFNHKNVEEHMNQTILTVEDNEIDRILIEKILTKAGYKVRLAVDGAKGLESIKEVRPDLIVLDCEMPVMGGVEMCRRLKENQATASIPVLFLTSVDTPKNIIECFELDAENYLNKPISAKLLLSEVEAILKEHKTT